MCAVKMEYGEVAGIDKPISRLVQGGMPLLSGREAESFALLDQVYELGCNAFESAYIYYGGDSERTLGKWAKERGVRDKVVFITKGAHPNGERNTVTPSDITEQLHESLERMQSDYIDLYLLHRDDPAVAVGPIVEVLTEHLRAGKIRAFGGSNWTLERIREANEYADANGLVPFRATSPNFCLAIRFKEPWRGCLHISGPDNQAVRDWYAERKMPVFSWSSLAAGFFSGRFRRDNLDSLKQSMQGSVCTHGYCYEENFKRQDRVFELAEKKGLSSSQVALAYVLNDEMDVFALVGCETGDEFRDNCGALAIDLSPEERAWLDLRRDSP